MSSRTTKQHSGHETKAKQLLQCKTPSFSDRSDPKDGTCEAGSVHRSLHLSCGCVPLAGGTTDTSRGGEELCQNSTSLRGFCLSTEVYMHITAWTPTHIDVFGQSKTTLLSKQDAFSSSLSPSCREIGWHFPPGSVPYFILIFCSLSCVLHVGGNTSSQLLVIFKSVFPPHFPLSVFELRHCHICFF